MTWINKYICYSNAHSREKKHMNPKFFKAGFERFEQVMTGVPDRVPVTAQMHEFSMAWTGRRAGEFYTDPNILVEGIIKTAEDFEFDIPALAYDVYNIELEALGQRIEFPDHAAPSALRGSVILSEEAKLSHLRIPNPGVSARMPFVLAIQEAFRERTGTQPAIQFCAPFSLACLVRGYENVIQDVYEKPHFLHELLEILTDQVIAPWINVQKALFPRASIAVGADALCSPPMTSRTIIEEFSIPYILRLRELCPLQIAVVNWWGDSYFDSVDEFLELKRRVCAGLLRAQDPDVARVGVEVFKDFASKHDLVLEIGVGEGIVNSGPVQAIEDRIKDYIREGAPGGRFILYLTSLDATTPPEHVRAALKAVREYGRY
jgi:uroporphyrinogen-III decarboxylase